MGRAADKNARCGIAKEIGDFITGIGRVQRQVNRTKLKARQIKRNHIG